MFPQDPLALDGGVGEKAVRRILQQSLKVADRSLPNDAEHLRKLTSDISSMADTLKELRQRGQGATPQAESLAQGTEGRLNELLATAVQAVNRVEKCGIQRPAPTVAGRLEQARRWLEQPGVDDRGLGRQAIALVVEEGFKIGRVLEGEDRSRVVALCRRLEDSTKLLNDLCTIEQGNSPRALAVAKEIAQNLNQLKEVIRTALVDRVVEDLMDVNTPLKQFSDCVIKPKPDEAARNEAFEAKAANLSGHAAKAVTTARMVAAGTGSADKRAAEALIAHASQCESLAPQLVSAGRIRMVYPDNRAADEHFENLRAQYAEGVNRIRALCDEATDPRSFVEQSAAAIRRRRDGCAAAVSGGDAVGLIEGTSAVARLANRIIQVTRQEADNSEDAAVSAALEPVAGRLKESELASHILRSKSFPL